MDSAHLFSDDPRRGTPGGISAAQDQNASGTAPRLFDTAAEKFGIVMPNWFVAASHAALVLAAVVIVSSHAYHLALAIGGLFCCVLLIRAARYTTFHPFWLPGALVLVETLPYTNLLPVNPESRWWLHYPLLLIFCLPAIPAALSKHLITNFKLMLVYFAWGAVSIIYSLDPVISGGRLVPDLLLFFALALVALSTSSRADLYRVLRLFLLGSVFLIWLTVLASIALPRHVFIQGEDPAIGVYTWVRDISGIIRFEGIFNTPNAIGSLMLITVGIALALWTSMISIGQRVALAILILLAVILGAMADSRSPFVAMAIGIAAYLVWRYRVRGFLVCAAFAFACVLLYFAMSRNADVEFNRNISTLTGRTAAWRFEIYKISKRPLTGYGYDIEGAIFQDPHFPNWDKFWNRGPDTPTHEGYLSIAVGVGIPALVFWLFIILRPWITAFRRPDDPWDLKPIFFFLVLPLLCRAFAETGIGEVRGIEGLIFYFVWMIAERRRIGATASVVGEPGLVASDVDYRRLFASGSVGLLVLVSVIAVRVPSASASDQNIHRVSLPVTASTVKKRLVIAAATDARAASAYTQGFLRPSSRQLSVSPVKYFATLPPHAILPSGAQCAAEIPPTPETILGNVPFNRTTVSPTELATFRANGYTFEKLSSYAQYARIKGNYVGSTDMIMRFVACKYGINENVVRGQGWQESYWRQWETGDKRTRKLQCVQGDFRALWNDTISLVNGSAVTCPHCCYTSWSAWQTKVYYEWKTWPMIKDSTSFAGEYRYADTRSCINGDWAPYFAGRPAQPGQNTYAEDIAAYDSDPTKANLNRILWGCIGMHYSGGWYDAGAVKYIADIKGDMAHRRWLTPNVHITGP